MRLHKLSLADRSLFRRFLSACRHELCVFSFENIYIWQPLFDIRWQIIQGRLCVFFKDKIGIFLYLPPLGEPISLELSKSVFALMDKFNTNREVSRIENIEENQKQSYQESGLLVRDKYADYLCSRNELAGLTGNKFKSQRASYNYFIKHYNFSCVEFSVKHIPGCRKLFKLWADQRSNHSQDPVYLGLLQDSALVLEKIFSDYKKLDYQGLVVKCDEKITGFTFGYKLNKDTFCIVYEITDLSFKGLAQFIFRAFCQQLPDFKFINIMDDSGLENLKKTKLAYHPVKMVKGYIATRQ
ncbi:MAG: DUF2156 domain-containing protein [Candidatus Omnitrophica bacterium]|jgi:hypothetical protein|nr:DUF2156 domain-containing protein [Candidatus Omnitrophota bacterium]